MSLQKVVSGPEPESTLALGSQWLASNAVSGKPVMGPDANITNNAFPYVPYARDSYDTIAAIKAANLPDNGWTIPFTDADAAYEMRKQEQLLKATYDNWLMARFDMSDPAQARLMQELVPEQFKRREELIDYWAGLQTKYAKGRLFGPRSEEDLKLEFLIETGQIEMPSHALWEPEGFAASMAGEIGEGPMANYNDALPLQRQAALLSHANKNHDRYVKGLFNPWQLLTTTKAPWFADRWNPQDLRGNQTLKYMGPSVLAANQTWQSQGVRYGDNLVANMFAPAARTATYGNGFRFRRPDVAGAGP